jgi:hypothetical protein
MRGSAKALLYCLLLLVTVNAFGQLTISKTLQPECDATVLHLKNTSRDTTYFLLETISIQDDNCYYSDVSYRLDTATGTSRINLSSTAYFDIERTRWIHIAPDSSTSFILRNSRLTDKRSIAVVEVVAIYSKRNKIHISQKRISKMPRELRTFLF